MNEETQHDPQTATVVPTEFYDALLEEGEPAPSQSTRDAFQRFREVVRNGTEPSEAGAPSQPQDTAADKPGEDTAAEPVKSRPPVLIGTGMPASILLQAFGVWIRDAFGQVPYQVGSSVHGKQWRDVDVRLILPDKEFETLFPGYRFGNQIDAKWSFLCAAISALARQQTGLPVDFQIQPQTEANARFSPRDGSGTFRQPLMHFDYFDVERDLQQRASDEARATAARDSEDETTGAGG